MHKDYPKNKRTENINSPFLTPNLSTKKPPNKGRIIFGSEYIE